jgi:hypothetical protein
MEQLLLLSQCASGLGMFLLGISALLYVLMQMSRDKT